MKTNRLSKALSTGLNTQMTQEAHSAQIYLAYGAWADNEGLSGTANFLFRHAQEERNHMMKILEFILRRGAEVHVSEIPAPPENPTSLFNCFEKINST